MKPTFYFNVKNDRKVVLGSQSSKQESISMTPQFINTPSNSSQFGSLNGTGAIDAEELIHAI